MAAMVWLGPLAVTAAVIARAWRRDHEHRFESAVLGVVVSFALVSIAGVLLGLFALFDAVSLSIACASLAAMMWPWNLPRSSTPLAADGRRWALVALPLAIGLLAIGLRVPPAQYALAGRDQGTYTLRAQQLMRTGSFSHQDVPLARASAERGTRSGPADVLGLHPKRGESWREDTYEGAYRPGWYLVDRARGEVSPQFFHLHPTALAIAGLAAGSWGLHGAVVFESFLLVLVCFFVARRMLGSTFWAAIAALILAANPLAIWVHRTALSETPTSLLLWSSVLAILRTPDHDLRGLDQAAFLLGATAWVRGNAWLTAPLLLGTLWLLPGHAPNRRRAVIVFLTVIAGSVLAHADAVFPYLADELNKQLHVTWLRSPWTLVGGAACAVVAWSSIDALAFDRSDDGPSRGMLRAALPVILVLLVFAGVAAFGWMRALDPDGHARLDPVATMFGPVLSIGALVGLPFAARRLDLTRAPHVWLAAIATTIVATILLYAQRNLPQAGLYYYGRYLAPELLPAAALSCCGALMLITGRKNLRLRWALTATAVAGLAWTVASPLIRTPITRLPEFEGAGRLVDAIAGRLPPGAIVIAGGEGWHHGHTLNQVGGALAMKHGVDVLPYYGREAAYATAYELLVEGPRARGEAAPPVYLLLGEATHHYRPTPDDAPRAALDDLLPPPLRGREVVAWELFTDRLTPVERAMPTRVTRDELRMVLMRITVDPEHRGEQRWSFRKGTPNTLERRGGTPSTQGICLDAGAPLTLTLPPNLGPGSLVVVMTPGTASANASLDLRIDDQPVQLRRARAATRARDTLGPFARPSARTVTIHGLPKARLRAACKHGGVAEVRWLAPDRAASGSSFEAITFGPTRSLGHAVEPTLWVHGRGLSRYRPDITPPPEVHGLSLVVRPDAPLRFSPEPMPSGGALDVIVTLTHTDISEGAALRLYADDESVATIIPPAQRRGTWQSPPVRWTPKQRAVSWSLELESPNPRDVVHVRDIGLFALEPAVPSKLVRE